MYTTGIKIIVSVNIQQFLKFLLITQSSQTLFYKVCYMELIIQLLLFERRLEIKRRDSEIEINFSEALLFGFVWNLEFPLCFVSHPGSQTFEKVLKENFTK